MKKNYQKKKDTSNILMYPQVGQPEFESGTSSPPDLHANQLRYCPLYRENDNAIKISETISSVKAKS